MNFGQGQYNAAAPTTMRKCGQAVQVQPPNDVAICNGQLVEAQTDQHGVPALAMYPKQPFDIAGRTGTIAFDVSDDSHGSHRAWPEIWYTDQPVPAPYDHFSSLQSTPKNGFGVRFAGACPAGQSDCRRPCPDEPTNVPVVTVDSADVVNNYVSNDSFMDVGTGTISVTQTNCVKASSGPGDMNHFELRVSQNEIDVYGADAGAGPGAPVKEIAIIGNMSLTLTRGLIWMEDVHYNGDKDGPDQGTHTFTWDNVGFDGPILPRDLAFDVLDRLSPVGPNYPGLLNLGWGVFPADPNPLSVSAPGVYNIANAAGAILTFNYWTFIPVTISYQINGKGWHDQPWPFGACYTQNGSTQCGNKTVAVPVPLSEVQSGTNKIQFRSTDGTAVFNIDLVLVGAGGTVPPPTTTTTTVTLPKIFGNNTIGPLVDGGDANSMHGSRFQTSSTAANIAKISVYVDSVASAPDNQYQVAVYTANTTTGAPSALVAHSATGVLIANSWNTLSIVASLQPGTQYWLEYETNGNNNLHYLSVPTFGVWPTPADTYQAKVYSIYATLQ